MLSCRERGRVLNGYYLLLVPMGSCFVNQQSITLNIQLTETTAVSVDTREEVSCSQLPHSLSETARKTRDFLLSLNNGDLLDYFESDGRGFPHWTSMRIVSINWPWITLTKPLEEHLNPTQMNSADTVTVDALAPLKYFAKCHTHTLYGHHFSDDPLDSGKRLQLHPPICIQNNFHQMLIVPERSMLHPVHTTSVYTVSPIRHQHYSPSSDPDVWYRVHLRDDSAMWRSLSISNLPRFSKAVKFAATNDRLYIYDFPAFFGFVDISQSEESLWRYHSLFNLVQNENEIDNAISDEMKGINPLNSLWMHTAGDEVHLFAYSYSDKRRNCHFLYDEERNAFLLQQDVHPDLVLNYDRMIYVPFKRQFIIFGSAARGEMDSIWCIGYGKCFRFNEGATKMPSSIFSGKSTISKKLKSYHVLLTFDFIAMVIDRKESKAIWCLNLLDDQWLECSKRAPAIIASSRCVNTAENELHVWRHGKDSKTHVKFELHQLLPQQLSSSCRSIVHGFVRRELPLELLQLIQQFWLSLG